MLAAIAAVRSSTLAALRGLALAAVALVSACTPADETGYAPTYSALSDRPVQVVYRLAIHPLHNPKRLFELYQPLVDHLNARLQGVQLRLEASSDYGAFEQKLKDRAVHFALPNPHQAVQARPHGYHVFAKMGDDHDFRGLLLVRGDSGIQHPRDLVGKVVSYPAPSALAATLLPQRWLHDQGIDVLRDLDNQYVGTQESSIMSVALGRSSAAATWPQPWRMFVKEHPQLASQLEVRWQTMPLINNALVFRDDLPANVVVEFKRLLLTLHEDPAGRAILDQMSLDRFEPATDDTYQKVHDFVQRFERDVRPVNPT
jgi:phosphonate transport system substrate-binding protein